MFYDVTLLRALVFSPLYFSGGDVLKGPSHKVRERSSNSFDGRRYKKGKKGERSRHQRGVSPVESILPWNEKKKKEENETNRSS